MTTSEVRSYLGTSLGFPAGAEAAQLLKRHTDGFPTLLDRVADQLRKTPLGKRALLPAIRRARTEPGFGTLLATMAPSLQAHDQQTRHRLALVDHETSGSLVAYALSALVPAARGD
ncbi:hypothetical protein HGQ17_13975 [Nesterenkonia sp. MY13]|uniref:Uncharacterized protein n=1 Tax=Nesterenkonia sedimenti TaxID=1463632 RepID=A0A7X8TN43_9MICC|nr:hypothetical protein [Nesterenkonia sedimenti]NLS11083.1 hypothetical protein [Nesterenkonia sedimenti]